MGPQVTELVLLLTLLLLGSGKETALVPIPGGVMTPFYSVGSQQVRVEPFLLEAYPVTNAQFLKFVLRNP